MKPTAWLVNTPRGPLVDEIALIDAVEAKALAGIALDVFNVEPLPSYHRLRALPNCPDAGARQLLILHRQGAAADKLF